MEGNVWQQLGVLALAVAFGILFGPKYDSKKEAEKKRPHKKRIEFRNLK